MLQPVAISSFSCSFLGQEVVSGKGTSFEMYNYNCFNLLSVPLGCVARPDSQLIDFRHSAESAESSRGVLVEEGTYQTMLNSAWKTIYLNL
jgi:hypothetical protein